MMFFMLVLSKSFILGCDAPKQQTILPVSTQDEEKGNVHPIPSKPVSKTISNPKNIRIFELSDGTKITGVLIGTNEEGFLVQTKSIGTLTIPSTELIKMRPYSEMNPEKSVSKSSLQDPSPTRNLASDPKRLIQKPNMPSLNQSGESNSIISNLQDKLMQDPNILGDLYTLQNDPSVMGIIEDPEILMLIQNGDFVALANHPSIKKLESNKSIQSIIKNAQP